MQINQRDVHQDIHDDKQRRKSMVQTNALMTWVGGRTDQSPDVNSAAQQRKGKRRRGFPKIGLFIETCDWDTFDDCASYLYLNYVVVFPICR